MISTLFPLVEQTRKEMPDAMREAYDKFTVEDKLLFLLSPLNAVFNSEWVNIYRNILIFVNIMYDTRKEKYKIKKNKCQPLTNEQLCISIMYSTILVYNPDVYFVCCDL